MVTRKWSKETKSDFIVRIRSATRTGTYENRYHALHSDSEGDTWQLVDRDSMNKGRYKRMRRSTGGGHDQPGQFVNPEPSVGDQGAKYEIMSRDNFRNLTTDEKLVTMFDAITNIGSLGSRVQKVESRVTILESNNASHDARLRLLEYKSIDMEARSRRHNLIFRGHPENVENDDCEQIIRNFLGRNLELNPNLYIQRAHRIGSLNRVRRSHGHGGKITTQPRPIIVNFRDYEDVELILANAKKLKNTNFGINRDYPKEIISARSTLWPTFKKARADNPNGSVYIGYPAKLIVNGRVLADQFPEWRKVLKGSRERDVITDTHVSDPGEKHEFNDDATASARYSNDPKFDAVELHADDDNVSEVVSMTSLRSRSRSKSNSRSRSSSNSRGRAVSKSMPGSRHNSRSLSKKSTTDRLESYIRDELLQRAVQNAEKRESKKEDSTKIPNKAPITEKVNPKPSENQCKPDKIIEPISDYDREMKRLEKHTVHLTQPNSEGMKDKTGPDTGQMTGQNQQN